jgi:hypothetical protein
MALLAIRDRMRRRIAQSDGCVERANISLDGGVRRRCWFKLNVHTQLGRECAKATTLREDGGA